MAILFSHCDCTASQKKWWIDKEPFLVEKVIARWFIIIIIIFINIIIALILITDRDEE